MITRAIIVLLVLLFALACYFTWRAIGTGRGQHVAPRGWAEAGERIALPCERAIPRAATEHAPPWENEPVIEPAAVTSGPPLAEPEAYWIAAGTVSDGQVTALRVTMLPPAVEELLGHRTVDDALESMFTRAMARQVRALTDGAS